MRGVEISKDVTNKRLCFLDVESFSDSISLENISLEI